MNALPLMNSYFQLEAIQSLHNINRLNIELQFSGIVLHQTHISSMVSFTVENQQMINVGEKALVNLLIPYLDVKVLGYDLVEKV